MSKSKRAGKAKRRTVPVYQLALFGKKRLVGRELVPTPAERAESERDHRRLLAYFASDEFRQRKAREAARAEEHRRRIARRPESMRSRKYRLPDDVAAFLARLQDNPLEYDQREQITVAESRNLIEAAYMEGCRQGFIEGFLYGEDKARPGALKNRERLRQQNLDKLAKLGIEDRNAEIVAEFDRLEREMPGKEERKEKLAADYELTPRQIGNIIRKAKGRR